MFLSCSLVAGELARQIGLGYICPVFVVVNWILEVLNAFGVICFVHGTRKSDSVWISNFARPWRSGAENALPNK